jgi:tetrahydromethanopterin S-methyltransferase subunit G
MHAHPLEVRMAHIEGTFDQINERLGSIDRRFESIDRRFESIDRRFESVDRRFDQVDRRFNWLIGIVVGTWITTMATQITTTLTILSHH